MSTLTVSKIDSTPHLVRSFVARWIPVLTVAAVLGSFGLLSKGVCAQEIQWHPDLATATKAAEAQDKLVFMHFTASWCKPCKTLDTFVFTNQGVQRAFHQNVAAVKIDVDEFSDIVQEYGVASVPFDVVMTPAGRVVAKRKSPRDASAYQKMVADLHSILAAIAAGNSPALAQNLSELQSMSQPKKRLFEGQPMSFTPDAPSYPRPRPSLESAELKRKAQVISNPFVKPQTQQPAPQRVANAFHAAQNDNMSVENSFHPAQVDSKSDQNSFQPPQDNASKENSFQPAPHATGSSSPDSATFAPNSFAPKSFTPQAFALETAPHDLNAKPASAGMAQSAPPQTPPKQKFQFNPYAAKAQPVAPRHTALKRLEESDAAARLLQEQAQQRLAAAQAKPKVIMNDKFYDAPTPKQVDQGQLAGNYQAKITLREPKDFLPPEPPSFGDAAAKIVLAQAAQPTEPEQKKPIQKAVAANQFQPSATTPINVASPTVKPPTNRGNAINRGLELAAEPVTAPAYALHGKCPVTLLKESKWVDGDPKFGCVHRNRTYIFHNEENLKAFQSDPDANSPILAGYDPVVFQESGRLLDGLEKHGVFMGNPPNQRIVLFQTAESRARFQSEPKKYLEAVRQAMNSTGASSNLIR